MSAAAIVAVTCAWIGGCASADERAAFDDWIRAERTNHRPDEGAHGSARPSAAGQAIADNDELPRLGPESSLDDYLAFALLHNPSLEAAFNRWKAALERIPQARTLPDPRFTYRYYIENVETRVGPQRQRFGFSQLFPWFGKLDRREGVALEAARAAEARYQGEKLKLFFGVKSTYYEYYYLARAVDVVRENRDLVKYLERIARTRFKAAAANHPDVIRAQVELGKLEDQLKTVQEMRGPMAARLNAALNRPIDAPLPWPKTLTLEPVDIDEERIIAWLRLYNPRLRAKRHESAGHRERILLARKGYFPDITVGVDYIETGNANSSNTSDSGKDAVAAGFSVNLPIWREKYDAAVNEALAHFGAVTRERVAMENTLLAELKTQLFYFRDAERKIDLYRDTLVPKARQSIKATEAAFRTATAGFTDLIDAERVLLEFALAYERALADRAIRLAEIELLVGRPLASWDEAAAIGADDNGADHALDGATNHVE